MTRTTLSVMGKGLPFPSFWRYPRIALVRFEPRATDAADCADVRFLLLATSPVTSTRCFGLFQDQINPINDFAHLRYKSVLVMRHKPLLVF